MNLLSLAVALGFIAVKITIAKGKQIVCDGLIFNDVYYDKKVIVSNFGRPYNLVMHKFSGLLFFSHTVESVSQIDFGILACQTTKKNKCMEVKGITGGYAVAYDAGSDDIYLGGHDGIHKYNFLTKTAEFFAEKGKSIWAIFIKRNFYYIEYPSQKLHVLQDDIFIPVAEATKIEIDTFFISKQRDIYFSNRTALFKVPRPAKVQPVVLSDDIVVRQIVEDIYGDVYFCASDGIYIEEKPFHRVKKVVHVDHAFGLAFDDHDHIIFSNHDTIYKLLPSNNSDACYNAIKQAEETPNAEVNI